MLVLRLSVEPPAYLYQYLSIISCLMCITDVNECSIGQHNCHTNARCVDTAGSYTCECSLGYTGDGISQCSGNYGWCLMHILRSLTGLCQLKYSSTGCVPEGADSCQQQSKCKHAGTEMFGRLPCGKGINARLHTGWAHTLQLRRTL